MSQRRCRWAFLGVHVLFAGAILVSAVYYRDRLFGDLSHYVWYIANGEKFAIFFSRYSNMLYQWPAVAAAKAGAPLQTIAVLFSVSSVLYYYVIALILMHVCRDVRAALALFLFLAAVSTHCFVWPIDESGHGLATLFLLPGLMKLSESFRMAAAKAVFALVVCLIAGLFHALAILAALLLLAVLFANASVYSRRMILLTLGALFLLGLLRYLYGGIEQTEMGKMQWPDLMSLASRCRGFAGIHSVLLLLCVLTFFLLLGRSLYLMAGAFLLAISALLFIIVLRYDPRATFAVYFWHISTPMYALVLLAGTAALSIRKYKWESVLLTGVSGLILMQSILGIAGDVRWYRERRALITRLTDTAERRKIVCATVDEYVVNKAGAFSWAIIDESILQTSLASTSVSRVIAPREKVGWHDLWKAKSNPRYFTLPERIREDMFTPLNTPAAAQKIVQMARQSIRLEYEIPSDWKPGTSISLPVTLNNAAGIPLPSRSTDEGPVCIGYAWVKDGRLLPPREFPQPLEADIDGTYVQPLQVRTPVSRENQTLLCFLQVGGTIVVQQ